MLIEEVEKVSTREDLVKFLNLMVENFKKNSDEWENRDIVAFLDGMSSWIEDMDGYYKNMNLALPQNVNWSFLANALYAARIYE